MSSWVAVSYGVLDASDIVGFEGVDVLALPIFPAEPVSLVGQGRALWLRLIALGPVDDAELSATEREIVRDMAVVGLSSDRTDHPARVQSISRPWLTSPVHELVYALVASLARRSGLPAVFIKGPALHAQGLRQREHSGDVDVWVDPARYGEMCALLDDWGWRARRHEFHHSVYHSVTLEPGRWGCEIDVHFRFPGMGATPDRAFACLEDSAQSMTFAGVASKVPGVAEHAVLLSLHGVRPTPGNPVLPSAWDAAAATLLKAGSSVIGSAAAFEALPALRPALATAYPGLDLSGCTDRLPSDWRYRSAKSTAAYHLLVLRSLRWRERPRAFCQVVWPSTGAARASARSAGLDAATGFGARIKRLVFGVRQVLGRR